MRVIVYHDTYGCDTGCCGHSVELRDDSNIMVESKFTFDHPHGQNFHEFAEDVIAKEFGEEHVKDLDWESCRVSE